MKKVIALFVTLLMCISFAAVVHADPVCDHTDGTGTTLVRTAGVEATCTEDGCKEYWTCSVCGKHFSDQKGTEIANLDDWKITDGEGQGLITALGHDYQITDTKEPTCVAEGVITYKCSRCGDSYTESKPATGHFLVNGVCTECGAAEDVALMGDGNWYYVIGQDIQYDYTGIKPNANGWWRIVNGKVDFDCNSVECNEYGWFCIHNGKVDFDYTGIAQNENGWWRIVNGAVDFGCYSVEANEFGWWYITGGKVDFDYTGLAPNENGWWRIEGGRVNFDCNSIIPNEYGWWLVRNGKVMFDYTGIAENEYGWWRIVNGAVDFECNSIEENENGWWYLVGGKVDFDYIGFASNGYGTWYVENGKVTFNVNGEIYGTINGVTQTWFVSNSQVMFGADKESFTAKAQSYSSNTGWLILVDCNANVFGVFSGSQGNWQLEHFWRCTTGAGETKTPKGIFQKMGGVYSFSGPDDISPLTYSNPLCYTVYYASLYASGGYYIHSTLYRYQTFEDMDDRLGYSLSHGCIRLDIDNAKWVYYNIPNGTTIATY